MMTNCLFLIQGDQVLLLDFDYFEFKKIRSEQFFHSMVLVCN
jgi:hypothetical protein